MSGNRQMVILFGAGATRGAFKDRVPPPPLDRDFFDVAGQIKGRGTPRLAKRVIQDVFNLYNQSTGVGLEQYFRDIETRAHIGRFAKTKGKPKDWARRTRDLEELIRRVMLHTTCDFDQAPARVQPSEIHGAILRHVHAGDTLITFNYDTVVEESFLPGAQVWDPGDGYGINAGGKTLAWAKNWRFGRGFQSEEASDVKLLKLHGSLNWTLYNTRQVRLKRRPYVVRANAGKPVFQECAVLPPGWKKRIDGVPFRSLWRQARLKLEVCSTLVIIGYSLPETDLLARAVFGEASRTRAGGKKWLNHLYVANPNEEATRRLVDLFVPALGPVGCVYRYNGIKELGDAWKTAGPKR